MSQSRDELFATPVRTTFCIYWTCYVHLDGGGAEKATSLTAAVGYRVFARSATPQQVALSFSRVSVLQ